MKLKESLQQYNLSVAIPNELFTQLLQMKEDKELKPVHIGFTYSYIYLQTYMYRYSTYSTYVPSVEEIKELFGYNPAEQRVNYIIKKNGLLEKKNILTTTNEFPVISDMVYDEYGIDRVPKITTIQEFCNEYEYETVDEWRGQMGITRRTTCKYPVFGFERYPEEDENGVYYEEGTFFNISDTTMIDMDTFLFCMSTDDIGVNGFYVYAYLLDKSNKFNGDFNATYMRIAKETGIGLNSITNIMNALRSHNLITTVHNVEYFSFAVPKKDRVPSTHKVNTSADFSADKIEYEKLKFISDKWYKEKFKDKFKNEDTFTHDGIDIDISDLPF
ncbi:helix-turn-helix domain-containing protein [Lysinibacillus sp. NPDC086135]|uniref:helix-turn-helix domain-containing protein n=1 Tax=Lysinibacillus sp. NPDC086135 TaxID=3364130 RepID=UPI00380DE99D